jgi:chlorobactene glucosyltransferase
MLVLISGAIWAGVVAYLLARTLRQFSHYRRASISTAGAYGVSSAVSIIVPVRNEIANLDLCLAGLSAQTGLSSPACIIVVDDGSEDGSRAAAEHRAATDPGIRLVDAGPLPAGWAGKPHACWRGASLADRDWLCFVDADVRVAPRLLAAAITVAEAQRIDMLSLHPLQELGSLWERLLIPAGMLVLACAKHFESTSPDIVNGQFLLIRHKVYQEIGGHSAVRDEICEDKALAARIRARGFELQVLAAEHLARTRMYRDLPSLWEGFSKNATEALGSIGATLTAGFAAFLFGWAALLLPLAAVSATFAEPSAAAAAGSVLAVIGTAVVIGIHFGTVRYFRIPAVFGLSFTLGYTAVALLACCAVMNQLHGRVRWKGRTYRRTTASPGRM